MALFRKSDRLRQQEPAVADRSFQAEIADDLASTVEHVLNTRYARTPALAQPEARPARVVQEITAESLMAELAAARQSRPVEPRAGEPKPAPRSTPPALKLLAFIGVAMIAYALLLKSPWRGEVPSLDRITQLLH